MGASVAAWALEAETAVVGAGAYRSVADCVYASAQNAVAARRELALRFIADLLERSDAQNWRLALDLAPPTELMLRSMQIERRVGWSSGRETCLSLGVGIAVRPLVVGAELRASQFVERSSRLTVTVEVVPARTES